MPPGRVDALARVAVSVKAQSIARMTEERRIATLVAFARKLEATATDDALDLFDRLVSDLVSQSQGAERRERMRTIKDLDAAALALRDACELLLDSGLGNETNLGELRAQVFARTDKQELSQAVTRVGEIARPPDEDHQKELLRRWQTARAFLPDLLVAIDFQGTEAAGPVLEALDYLKDIDWKGRKSVDNAPISVVSKGWQHLAVDDNGLRVLLERKHPISIGRDVARPILGGLPARDALHRVNRITSVVRERQSPDVVLLTVFM